MSKINISSEIFQQELSLNDDAILITSVDDLISGWKKKQAGTITRHISLAPAHLPTSTNLNNTDTIPSTMLCHWSKSEASLHTDSVPSITKENIAQLINFVDKYVANWIVPLKDVLSHVVPIAKDLGFNGKVILKRVKTVDYVIIKGYAGRRTFLTSTRYLSTHPKILQLAIGKIGLQQTIKGGGRLTAYITVSLEILQMVLGEKEIRECGIAIASDLTKIGIATVLAEAVGLWAAGTATIGAIAVGPIILTIVVGVGVGIALDYFDSEFNITNRVAALMESMAQKISEASDEATGTIYQALKYGIYRATGGIDIENPVHFH